MIRIVGIERNVDPEQEFILLQNQGHMRVHLKGHSLLAEACLSEDSDIPGVHFFAEDDYIPPGCFVLLQTAPCASKWSRTKDGAMLLRTSMGRKRSVWDRVPGTIHVLNIQHSYCERATTLVG